MPILHHFPCPSYKLYDAKLPHFDASTSTTTKHYQTNPTTIIPPPKQTPQTKHHHNHHLNQRKKNTNITWNYTSVDPNSLQSENFAWNVWFFYTFFLSQRAQTTGRLKSLVSRSPSFNDVEPIKEYIDLSSHLFSMPPGQSYCPRCVFEMAKTHLTTRSSGWVLYQLTTVSCQISKG